MDTQSLRSSIQWTAGAVIVPIIALALYLGAVFSVYALAFVLGLIGDIFG